MAQNISIHDGIKYAYSYHEKQGHYANKFTCISMYINAINNRQDKCDVLPLRYGISADFSRLICASRKRASKRLRKNSQVRIFLSLRQL
jgi:hypothetical protein